MRSLHKRVLFATLVAATVALAQGCASKGSNDESGVIFPDIGSSYIEEGTFVAPQNVLRVSQGQSKDQVRHLLDNPHFNTGLLGVNEWNYIFNFDTDRVPEGYMTCQYQVGFDEDMLVERTDWKNSMCADLLIPIEIESAGDEKKVTLATDLLFDFDSDVLRLEGQRSLERFADILQRDFTGAAVRVVGHTDRIGSEAYNLALSERRAQAVKRALINTGISTPGIQALGVGEKHPLVSCSGKRGTELKACLQPNRRVNILIDGENKIPAE